MFIANKCRMISAGSCWKPVYISWVKPGMGLKAAARVNSALPKEHPGWKLGDHLGATVTPCLSWPLFLPLCLFAFHYHNYNILFQLFKSSYFFIFFIFTGFTLFSGPSQQGWGRAGEELCGTWLLAEVKLISLNSFSLSFFKFKLISSTLNSWKVFVLSSSWFVLTH